MNELGIRSIVAVVLLAILALMLWLGGWVQAGCLTFAAVVAVLEMERMFRKKDIYVSLIPLFVVAGAQFAVMLLFPKNPEYIAILYIIGFLLIVAERILNRKRTTEDFLATVFVLVYPLALLLSFGFFGFDRMGVSRVALLLVFAGPSMADNNAYMFGSKFGKHKLCPSISPAKTVEGYIAGLVGGPMGGLLVYFLQKLWGLDVHWAWLVGLGFLGGFVGQFGDLLASTFKRWSGIKDYGHIFPGHGGIIDRLDSAMVFAPIVAIVFACFIK